MQALQRERRSRGRREGRLGGKQGRKGTRAQCKLRRRRSRKSKCWCRTAMLTALPCTSRQSRTTRRNGTDAGSSKRPRGRPGPVDPEDKRKLLHEGAKDGGRQAEKRTREHYEDGQGEAAEKGEARGEKKGEVEDLVEKILECLDDMEDKGGKFNETVEKQGAVLGDRGARGQAPQGAQPRRRGRRGAQGARGQGREARLTPQPAPAPGRAQTARREEPVRRHEGMGRGARGGDMSLMTMLFGKTEQQQAQTAEGGEGSSPGKGAETWR